MDIIFQSGQFYGENSSFFSVLSSFLGALITGGIAIYIFNRGNKYNELKEEKRKLQHLKEYQSLIISSCNLIYLAINEQINKISSHNNSLKDFNNKNIRMIISPALTTDDFNYLDNKTLFDLFVTYKAGDQSEKVKEYLQFKSAIRHLERNIINLTEHNQKIEKNLNSYRIQWNENMEILHNLHNQYIKEAVQSSNDEDVFLKKFSKIIISYPKFIQQTKQNDNIEIAHSYLVESLYKFIKGYDHLSDNRLPEIIKPLQKCDIAYKETFSERYNRRRNILKYGRSLLGIKNMLYKTMLAFEEREFKT